MLLLAAVGCGGGGSPTSIPSGLPAIDLDIDSLGLEFVWIEPGTFLMGSPPSEPGRREDEGPQHQVTLTWGFWMGKYEITQEQWFRVMGTRPWQGRDYVVEDPRRPAVYVSWSDVQDFLGRLNLAAGEELYFLPTEAEWEYACRAGTQTAWSCGNDSTDLGEYAWYSGNAWEAGLRAAQPVGFRKPNPWGLYDCHGNVWEWVYDIYGAYPDTSVTDPTGVPNGAHNVIRGGSFYYGADETRCAARYFDYYRHRDSNLGFRIVRIGTDEE